MIEGYLVAWHNALVDGVQVGDDTLNTSMSAWLAPGKAALLGHSFSVSPE